MMTNKRYNLAEWLHNRRGQWDNKAFWCLNASMIVAQVKEYETEIEHLRRTIEEYERDHLKVKSND